MGQISDPYQTSDDEPAAFTLSGFPGEPLDLDRDQIAYDLSEWDDDRLAVLVAELDEAGIAYEQDADELFVYADDEQAVDDLVDRVAHPHELAPEDDDGAAGGELLGELFVAADRLQHDAGDQQAATALLDLDDLMATTGPPYGLEPPEWERLRGSARTLAEQLRGATIDEDAAMVAAGDLRTALRPYV